MRQKAVPPVFAALLFCFGGAAFAAEKSELPPIKSVEIKNRTFQVNGEPFFPLMGWLQGPANFETIKSVGMNSTAGFSGRTPSAPDRKTFLDLLQKAGLYGVMPFNESIKGHPALLGYIHGDEPDLTHPESDAQVVPASELRINPRNPLWKLVDGDLNSWTVFDPLEGAAVTIKLKQPVTAAALAVHVTVSGGLSVAKEVTFSGDGKEVLKATLEPKRGRQKFELPAPATFRELTMKVLSIQKGSDAWGSVGEVEGFDKDGKNVLLSPPRDVVRAMPEVTLREYNQIKAADPSRPIFMTLTSYFLPFFKKGDDSRRALYPDYIKCTDVIGYDVYPIYGWNKPEWLYLVHDATELLVKMAGPRPVYAWIETSKGGQWTGELANQKDVTPAHIRCEVWMAICRGATAIGYFTHIWKPSYQQFGVPEENRKALLEINNQITRLAPAILGDEPKRAVSIQGEGDVKLDVMAKQKGSELYLFAVNYDERAKATRATIKVEGLAAGSEVTVVDENRTIKSEAGSFGDAFEPLAVHIYRVGR